MSNELTKTKLDRLEKEAQEHNKQYEENPPQPDPEYKIRVQLTGHQSSFDAKFRKIKARQPHCCTVCLMPIPQKSIYYAWCNGRAHMDCVKVVKGITYQKNSEYDPMPIWAVKYVELKELN